MHIVTIKKSPLLLDGDLITKLVPHSLLQLGHNNISINVVSV